MAIDLIVPQGETLDLGGEVPAPIRACIHDVRITKFSDFVREGFIESPETIRRLVTAAQDSTRAALNNGGPARHERGDPSRIDLGRYGRFIAAVPDVHPREINQFWRLARRIQPTALISRVTPETLLSQFWHAPIVIVVTKFKDVTIEPQATLVVHKDLWCGHLLIKKTAKMIVSGSGVCIRAQSMKGQQ